MNVEKNREVSTLRPAAVTLFASKALSYSNRYRFVRQPMVFRRLMSFLSFDSPGVGESPSAPAGESNRPMRGGVLNV